MNLYKLNILTQNDILMSFFLVKRIQTSDHTDP